MTKHSILISHIASLPKRKFSKLAFCSIFPHLTKKVSLVYERLAPRTRLPFVRHERTDELVYCLSGTVVAFIGNRTHRLKPGSIVWIPKKTWHSFLTGKAPSESLSLFMPAINFDKQPDVKVKAL